MSDTSTPEQPLNFTPVLETFTTPDIDMAALVSIGSQVSEQMLDGISPLREHLKTIEPGRYTIGEVRNDGTAFSVKIAALNTALPATLRGIRVTHASNNSLVSFALFADQDDGGLMPIDFDIVS